MKRALVVMAIALLPGCAAQLDRRHMLAPENLIPDATPVLQSEYQAALAEAQARPQSSVAVRRYTEAGIALADQACMAWLARVSAAERVARMGSGGLDVTSGLATTIMGLANASATVVGSVGAGFTALAGYTQVYEGAVLMAPSSYQAQARLMQILGAAAANIRDDPAPTWSAAYGQLVRYQRVCSYETIKAAVDDALSSTQTIVQPIGVMRTVPR